MFWTGGGWRADLCFARAGGRQPGEDLYRRRVVLLLAPLSSSSKKSFFHHPYPSNLCLLPAAERFPRLSPKEALHTQHLVSRARLGDLK